MKQDYIVYRTNNQGVPSELSGHHFTIHEFFSEDDLFKKIETIFSTKLKYGELSCEGDYSFMIVLNRNNDNIMYRVEQL